ncbi:FMN-binding protein MioC [Candidatus Fukatsuia anoeciicola]|uniref:FMN-binding protein MioC n=1 Tax=Candidatus Fukatsuia anoeciicola TaxID=2994492 RepID=UPI003464872E
MSHITLISGSTLGNAEDIAKYLSKQLNIFGFTTKIMHGPKLNELVLNGKWLVITSTYGSGELPKNLQPLLEEIKQQKPNLSQIHFGAIGLGDSSYDYFCGAIKKINQELLRLGAKRIGQILKIDALKYSSPRNYAEKWLVNWIQLHTTK